MEYYKEYDPLFCIMEDSLKKDQTKHYEGVFAQGSGYLHIRGSHEEGLIEAEQDEEYMRMPANVTIEKPHHPRSKVGTYIPGITGIHPLLKEEIVNLPNILSFTAESDGEKLDMDSSKITEYNRHLDMRDGVLYREFNWHVNSVVIGCYYKRYVSKKRKHLIVQEMSFTAKSANCKVRFTNDIDIGVKTNGYQHFADVKKAALNNQVNVTVLTDNDNTVKMASKVFSDNMIFSAVKDCCMGEVLIKSGNTVNIKKLSYLKSSRDLEKRSMDFEQITTQLDNAYDEYETLYNENSKAWESAWEDALIEIKGDDAAQKAVNFSIYHMLRAVNDNDSRVAICAKGFAGEAYFGHFFWDTEIYLLPFFLYTNTNLAKNLAEFRIKTLDGAKQNAKSYGYDGARYPWESSVSGKEQCPNWQYADNEVHITADVTFGLWHYYTATQDKEFLKAALPVFIETAKYWLSRVEYRTDGSINLNGVMGPDEYICFCNNNAYTNYMVSVSLKNTVRVLEIFDDTNLKDNDFISRLLTVADKLDFVSENTGVIKQCDDFDKFEEPHFDKIWTDRTKPFGSVISQEKNYRVKALKQADVLMLPYLFSKLFSKEQIKLNYDFYFPYTTHDSSLSCIIHSILCNSIDRPKEAYELFCRALDIDLSEEKAGAAEGIHIANCGGIWQGVVFGFAGMSKAYESEELSFNPKLPESFESLAINLVYNGKKYRAEIDKTTVKIKERV